MKRIYQNRELLIQSRENQNDEEEKIEIEENNEENNKKIYFFSLSKNKIYAFQVGVILVKK